MPRQARSAAIERFAPVDVPILIRGESGTGKGLVAKAIHRLSGRRERPFEMLNCADLSRELLRSELFGHERVSQGRRPILAAPRSSANLRRWRRPTTCGRGLCSRTA
ncbi:MAG TPA: sigma 54-interacting transcriptional regulator [Verrucomicrobiae bacterium]|nr:sigma 54-interacting transcriptional regulator [Verrucomicrobiae bacterium]